MQKDLGIPGKHGLEHHGLHNLRNVYWNLFPSELIEQVVMRQEGALTNRGAVMVSTGQHTGRSPNDKFIVRSAGASTLDEYSIWWGKVNRPIEPNRFDHILEEMVAYFQGKDVFVQDMEVGAHPEYRLPIRIITETAWHSLFARDLFLRLPPEQIEAHVPRFTVLHAPGFNAIPEKDGTNSRVFILVDFDKNMILIGGSSYAGEIKKSVFTIMNYLLPRRGVLSMHCSANVSASDEVALFFGLSGTGKTTLSSDPERRLIGDDEHGWGDDGVFNFEGGCYAKTINLKPELEPLIWQASRRFGAVLENVVFDPITRLVDFDDGRFTENTRAAYPLDFVPNSVPEGRAGHPNHVFFLTADAFGVIPPLSRLTPDQAMYYFLSGYTSKLAGTEKGLGIEPQATFSTCFGAPFLPLHPGVYAELLGSKISEHKTNVWLINTGWTGGPYGQGSRIKLPFTRAMVRAVLQGAMNDVPMRKDTRFGLDIPTTCPDVPCEVLDPRATWSDPDAYDSMAQALVMRFCENFKQYENQVSKAVILAGPQVC